MRPKKTILCVDPNEQQLSIRKFLLETKGYHVVACTNGRDAIKAFQNGGADLLLSDLLMPEMDGAELVKHIKTLSPETPAIVVSSKVKVYDKDLRADAFLPKGMHAPNELLERIRLLTVRKRGPKKAGATAARSVTVAS